MANHKGFNIKAVSEGIDLNIQVEQFKAWLDTLPKTKQGWASLRIYRLEQVDPRGYTHNMRQVIHNRQESN